jgi:hypothetical protein
MYIRIAQAEATREENMRRMRSCDGLARPHSVHYQPSLRNSAPTLHDRAQGTSVRAQMLAQLLIRAQREGRM